MIRNRLISSAIAATMLVSLSGAVLAQDEVSLEGYIRRATEASPEHPVLVDEFLDDAVDIDVDALYDGTELFRHEGFFSRADILAKWAELGFRWDEPAAAG